MPKSAKGSITEPSRQTSGPREQSNSAAKTKGGKVGSTSEKYCPKTKLS